MIWTVRGSVKGRASIAPEAGSGHVEGGAALGSSTPDALWSASAAHAVQASAVTSHDLRRPPLLDGCSFRLAPGVRLLVVAEPDETASMLVRILAGLARPTAGSAEVAGLQDAAEARRSARLAFVGSDPGVYGWMTPREAVTLSATLVGLGRAAAARRIGESLAWVELPAVALDRPMRRAGPAVVQRADLAAALVGAPEVLVLDEPLRALPPEERARLLRLPGRRLTMLVASRYPRGDRGVATHVMLLREGRVALLTTIAQLEASGYGLSRDELVGYATRRPAPAPDPDLPPPSRELVTP